MAATETDTGTPTPRPNYVQGEDPFRPARGRYEVLKEVAQGAWLVRRRADGEVFIGGAFNPLQNAGVANLLLNGSMYAASQVLNHENVVSIVGTSGRIRFSGSTGSAVKVSANAGEARDKDAEDLLLWDYMDAGNLASLCSKEKGKGQYDNSNTKNSSKQGHLPESLVWHVALSMLSALAWLHEGKRDKWTVSASPEWGSVALEPAPQELDWLPILHGGIHVRNVFFQKPRGIETYGACKLGNFSGASVAARSTAVAAGHSYLESQTDVRVMTAEAASKTEGYAVVGQVEDEKPTMPALVEAWKFSKEGDARVKGLDRPYTCGSDLYDLGAVLFQMMTDRACPPAHECPDCGCCHGEPDSSKPCTHPGCSGEDVSPVNALSSHYSAGLRRLVMTLLQQASTDEQFAASHLLHRFRGIEYQAWKRDTADGRMYRDFIDDMRWRWERMQARTGRWRERLEEQEAEDEAESASSGNADENDIEMR